MGTPLLETHKPRIAVIGLGYVGTPLACLFGRRFPTIGFDIRGDRVQELKDGRDSTRQVTEVDLCSARSLTFTDSPGDLVDANVYIVSVPTPVDNHKRPDLGPLLAASTTVGKSISAGDVVVFESTVYPGATEEECVPVIEHEAGLRVNHDFYVGYSPERVNPGDPAHGIADIVKVTSGSTTETADFVDRLYGQVISAGTHKAPSIRVAEAAKVIENTQRDVNIGLINELAILFERLGIDTREVLEAAGTKWNFIPLRPGLVGGHCVGVDPYYLTHKAQAVGFHPEMILAGRRTNDFMAEYIADRLLRLMTVKGLAVPGSRVLVLGATFKENCPDLRNSQVQHLVDRLASFRFKVDICDPVADSEEVLELFAQPNISKPRKSSYQAIVLAVAHAEFLEAGPSWVAELRADESVLYDLKSVFPIEMVDGRL